MMLNFLKSLRRQRAVPTILWIDDDPQTLSSVCAEFAGEPYRIEAAGSAELALRKLAESRPEVIVIDPEVSAGETRLARRLLADEDLVHIPIMALNGPKSPEEPVLENDYDASLAKPVTPESLFARLGAVLEGKRMPEARFDQTIRTQLRRLAELIDYPFEAYLPKMERLFQAVTVRGCARVRTVLRLCRETAASDPAAIRSLAGLRGGYLDRRQAELDCLDQYWKRRELDALAKAAHNLKGTGAAYGFSELTDLGRALEAAAKCGDAARAEVMIDRIAAYVSIVRPARDGKGEICRRIPN